MFENFGWKGLSGKHVLMKPKIEKPKALEPETPDRLISYGKNILKMFCKNFEATGVDELKKFKADHPGEKFVFAASHTNNLDLPAVLGVFGEDFDIQTTGNELFFEKAKYLVQNIGVRALFGDHFTRLGQKEGGDKKEHGVFRPENFTEIDEKIKQGRTPWMAAHSFAADGQMRQVDNGALIAAYRNNSWIIPTALEVTGGSASLQGAADLAKNLKSDSGAKYHVGEPYKPDPLPAGQNVDIISEVIGKRQRGEAVSDEEFKNFKIVARFLSTQSEKLGGKIAQMLPEEQRGFYKQKMEK